MRKLLIKLIIVSMIFELLSIGAVHGADSITFSDPNFESSVKSNCQINGEISQDDLNQVTELLLNSPESLNDLSKLPNVVSLDIYSSQTLKDYSALKNLKNLKRLCIKDCNVQNADNIVNSLKDIKLERLGIEQCGLYNLKGLENFQNLIQLELPQNGLNSIKEIGGLKKLLLLDLSQNKISDLNPLKDLKMLNMLNLSNNKIQDISALNKLTEISSLDLTANHISDFTPLSNMNKLNTFLYEDNLGEPGDVLQNHITVYVDNYKLPLDVYPIIRNGRVLIPFRALCEEIGATVEWNSSNGEITAEKKDKKILIKVGSNKGYINKDEKILDASPIILEGRTLVPVRFLSEALGCIVSWDKDQKKVDVKALDKKENVSDVLSFKNLEQSLNVAEITNLEKVPFEYYINPDYKINPIRNKIELDWLSIEQNRITDDADWYKGNRLSLPSISVPNPFYNKAGNLPVGIPDKYNGFMLVNAIECSSSIILVYGSNFSDSKYLASVDKKTGSVKYILDLENIKYAPSNARDDLDFVAQGVNWAMEEGNILYISRSHSTYSKSSYGMNAYITAIDTVSKKVIWNSQPLVSNTSNFEIIDDCIVTGYGFSDETDYLYVLNKNDGKVVQRLYLEAGPSLVIRKDDKVFVRGYDKNYCFKIIKN